jgi:hypothetical protein
VGRILLLGVVAVALPLGLGVGIALIAGGETDSVPARPDPIAVLTPLDAQPMRRRQEEPDRGFAKDDGAAPREQPRGSEPRATPGPTTTPNPTPIPNRDPGGGSGDGNGGGGGSTTPSDPGGGDG